MAASTQLSNNIRMLRKKHDLSQEQLAEKLGIKRSNIAAYESKNVEPRLRIILEMARLFDIQLKTFIDKKLTRQDHYEGFQDDPWSDHGAAKSSGTGQIYGNKSVKTFIENSGKIRKILDGFKAFYQFRKERIKKKTPELTRLMVDIENFMQLTDYLLSQNEYMINTISPNDQLKGPEQEQAK